MAMKLRRSLLPLYIVSKLLCTHPFSRVPLTVSLCGSATTIAIALGYAIFHLTSAQLSLSSGSGEGDTNIVALIIDSYNRYSGLCCFIVIVTTAILMQGRIVNAIRTLESIDVLLENDLGFSVDNFMWSR